ncbi:TonB-dependent receptor [Chryseolinea sp. Jin1]|uniref:TonB-dependent receptor n=1 Tax=Chryseolinea lacunae TaxID=2801331 RepID=A0ABS1KZG3_9BACT|nr:TonB-dependent receptor [Chryseolinea lacunae]
MKTLFILLLKHNPVDHLAWGKLLSLLLALLVTTGYSLAQGTLRGTVTNGVEAVPGATTSLLRTDSTLVAGVATGKDGAYTFTRIKSGLYLVRISMVGYETFVSRPVVVEDKHVALPEIILQESTTTLNAIDVTGQKIVFDQQPDKLVLNVASSVTSTGSTVLDVLQKSPGVVVNRQNSNITINGRTGVRLMIDGKMLQIPADAAMQMLDGMNAGGIETIELITSPSSQYDAEGGAGIVHIRTKTRDQAGTNILAGLTVGSRWAENVGATLNASHRSKQLNVALDYSFLRNHNLHTLDMQRETFVNDFNQFQEVHSRRENITTQQNLSLGAEWSPSKNTSFNFLFTAYERDWKLDANSQERYILSADSTMTGSTLIYESNVWRSATGSAGVTHRFNTTHSLTFGVDALFYRNENPSHYQTAVPGNDLSDENRIALTKTTPIRVLVAHADYTFTPSPAWRWDAGVKASVTHLNNNVSTMRYADGAWLADPAFTSYADLDEKIAAAYVSGQWNPEVAWQINAGVRYEYTQTHIATPINAALVDRRYGNFFPNVSIRKNIGTEQDLQVSYARRITRPTYNDIAPYVFFWASNTFSSGNTALYPSLSDQFTISYRVKQWNISLQGTRALRAIAYLQPERVGQSADLIYRSQNTDYSNTLALVSSTALAIAPW